MSLAALADRLVTVQRQTMFALDSTAATASMTADRQPTAASRLEMRVWGGTSNSGTVTVAGTVDGSADTEALVYTAAGYQTTQKRFTAISGVTTTGLADEATVPSIQIATVARDGSPILIDYEVVASWPMAFVHAKPSPAWPAFQPGTTETEKAIYAFEHTDLWTPRVGDVFVDVTSSDDEWLVVGIDQQRGRLAIHHWEARVQRREGSI
jgi:hypothetical protein